MFSAAFRPWAAGRAAKPSLAPASRNILRCSLTAAGALALCAFCTSPQQASAQTVADSAVPSADQAPLKLRVESNLVVVRVVVRDAQGHPVENLRKEDFRLFDNGKEQPITQFGVEAPLLPPQQKAGPSASAPDHFLAFYFDDLDMLFEDVVRARDAADRYLTANFRASDRAALFTSSGSIAVEFTSDVKQLHEALFKIRASSRLGDNDCPKISDYQAERIVNHEDADAYALATDDATNLCHIASTGTPLKPIIFAMAQRVLDQRSWQAQYSLQGLNQLVRHISDMPGQRNIILVSSGFLSFDLQLQMNAIVDRALHSQVVISSIDSKGLAVLPGDMPDIHVGYGTVDPHLSFVQRDFALNREQMAISTLEQLAEDTGGQFFHNDNDLNVGFRKATALSEVYYVLAFAPKNVKPDGRFHVLKVALSEHRPGITLQARRGYFAPNKKGAKAEDEAQDEIREATLSRVETQQLPVDISTELSKAAGHAELSVMARLELGPVRFRRNGERNANTVTFVSSIFNGDGIWVAGQQKEVRLDLSDATLQKLLSSPGVVVRTTFQLKPGKYTVREVVMDSEDHHLTALSRSVEIP
jgi:VWFA-related protein